jgi:hypothetical protein
MKLRVYGNVLTDCATISSRRKTLFRGAKPYSSLEEWTKCEDFFLNFYNTHIFLRTFKCLSNFSLIRMHLTIY